MGSHFLGQSFSGHSSSSVTERFDRLTAPVDLDTGDRRRPAPQTEPESVGPFPAELCATVPVSSITPPSTKIFLIACHRRTEEKQPHRGASRNPAAQGDTEKTQLGQGTSKEFKRDHRALTT